MAMTEVIEQIQIEANRHDMLQIEKNMDEKIQGRTVHLPCNLGTVFYSIISDKEPAKITVDKFVIDEDGISIMNDQIIYKKSLFGKYYFFDKEKALEAFKKLRSKNEKI